MITVDATALRDKLIAADIRAVSDPARIAPPCVFITPVAARFDTNCVGEGTTDWELWCIGPGQGTKNSFDACASLVAKVLPVFPSVGDVRSSNYGGGDSQYPAFVLSLTTISSWA